MLSDWITITEGVNKMTNGQNFHFHQQMNYGNWSHCRPISDKFKLEMNYTMAQYQLKMAIHQWGWHNYSSQMITMLHRGWGGEWVLRYRHIILHFVLLSAITNTSYLASEKNACWSKSGTLQQLFAISTIKWEKRSHLREGSSYQIGWIFGKIPNGLWTPPLICGKLCCNFFMIDMVAYMQGDMMAR